MQLIYALIILLLPLHSAFAEKCASDELFTAKYMILNGDEEAQHIAFNSLHKSKDSINTGEAEFYLSVIKYRQNQSSDALAFMQQSHEKLFFLSNAFYATAYSLGLFGFDKNENEANKYFEQYLELGKNCESMTKEMQQPEQIFTLILKIFGVPTQERQ
ncbi:MULTISPECIES: hypothetical protein [unclassified Methylophaga]|uniref:hypothetical protein n=1 Tax=unclassified Methylophaga TaxID=2629249 RepID=UPI000C8B1FD2|nr:MULTISPECIES: hypothetical protein [unclassified Methylophaga]MBN46194.1 hypothetical protein [Methylophaga sp.]|tara:strand:+ start:61191 stop:61667 length:477 start_codon:yes stop_codon:yes gene_type:complete